MAGVARHVQAMEHAYPVDVNGVRLRFSLLWANGVISLRACTVNSDDKDTACIGVIATFTSEGLDLPLLEPEAAGILRCDTRNGRVRLVTERIARVGGPS